MSISFLKNKSPEKKFWEWFSTSSNDYFLHLEDKHKEWFPILDKELHKVAKNLTYQFSPIKQNGKREFVISADGQKELIPDILSLVSASPKLERWEIIPFRQRQQELPVIEIEKFKVSPDDIYFEARVVNNKISITLFVKNYIPKKEYLGAIFIILDSAIGEYDAMTQIDSLEVKVLDESKLTELKPLKDLPKFIDNQKIKTIN